MKLIKILFFFLYFSAFAQNNPKISAEINKNEIKIGEQIIYKISVEDLKGKKIQFPNNEQFIPFEVVSVDAIDTFRINEKEKIVKKYYLTQFDSGHYQIPSQKIFVENKAFLTDSLTVWVKNVAVDTLKQPLFPIKTAMEVQKTSSNYQFWLIFIAIFVFLVGILIYFLFFRKKKLSEEEKIALLPPFDRAILNLKNLQKSRFLLESKHKEYYSQLTDIVRRYLEEEIKISATESTTDELIEKLNVLLNQKKLNLKPETIADFQYVLQKADLVKFAKQTPSDSEALNDLQTLENMVVKTQEAIPEEIWKQQFLEAKLKEELKKEKRRKIRILVSILCLIFLFFSGIIFSLYYAYNQYFVKDTAREYLGSKEWVQSVYGYPPVKISTPKPLLRYYKPISYPSAESEFYFGDENKFSMNMGFIKLPDNTKNDMQQLVQKGIEIAEQAIENKHKAQNIITTYEDYALPNSVQGIKILGSFDKKLKEKTIKMYYNTFVFFKDNTLIIISLYSNNNSGNDIKLSEKIIYSVVL